MTKTLASITAAMAMTGFSAVSASALTTNNSSADWEMNKIQENKSNNNNNDLLLAPSASTSASATIKKTGNIAADHEMEMMLNGEGKGLALAPNPNATGNEAADHEMEMIHNGEGHGLLAPAPATDPKADNNVSSTNMTARINSKAGTVYFGDQPHAGKTASTTLYKNWKLNLSDQYEYTDPDNAKNKTLFYRGTDMTGKITFWVSENNLKDITHPTGLFDRIISEKAVNYTKRISGKRNDGVYFYGPYNTSGDTVKRNANATQFNNWKVKVTKEKATSRATYVYVTDMTEKTSFWIDKRALV